MNNALYLSLVGISAFLLLTETSNLLSIFAWVRETSGHQSTREKKL